MSSFAADVSGRPEKADVIVTYAQPSGAFTPIWVAYEAGLFKKYGLNATLQLLTPQVSAQAVVSEEADFYTDGPDLLNARLRGGQVKYFGGTMQQLVFQMWGAKEINTIKDLKGKTVAASTPRAAVDTATREALKRNGLTPDKDVQILYVQTVPAILSSILGGKTAAGTLSAPNTLKAKESGLNLLVDIGKLNINRELARLPSGGLLENLGLISNGEVTLAAVLLLGRSPAIARWAGQHEVVFLRFRTATRYDVRHDLKGPFLSVLDALQGILSTHVRVDTVGTEGFGEVTVPDLTWWAAREAILNALVHRDYFLRQSVQVELYRDRLEVSSPGGFVGGVTPQNILRHPPVRRNPLLASVLQSLGLVNRAGLGVDRIHEELLRMGKPMPRYSWR